MISQNHVITAAHCFEGGRKQGFTVKGYSWKRKAKATHFNPDCQFHLLNDGPNRCDVAIVELETKEDDAPVTAVPVYNGSDEEGKTLTFFGWGVTGTADKISKRDCNDGPEDGVFRTGQNVVAKATAPIEGGGLIEYTMRANDDKRALPLEAICASGDSGSPAFITGDDGREYIAATDSGSDDKNGCAYGSTDQMCRLSRHYAWIQSVIGGDASVSA